MKITILKNPTRKQKAVLEKEWSDAVRRVFEREPVRYWSCQCGYSMPEPLKECVKCGEKRSEPSR